MYGGVCARPRQPRVVRRFSTGFSYGGMMSFAIGCEMSDVFRAIAPMSGSLDGRSALKKILQQNKCGTSTTPVDPSPCVKYQGCDQGYDVTWCEWDGPHGIPSFGSASVAAFFKSFWPETPTAGTPTRRPRRVYESVVPYWRRA
jgi:hypothetical protein